MFLRYCTWAFLVFLATAAQAQEAARPPSTGFTIFLKGTPIGREDVTVRTDASGVSIVSQGRLSVPQSVTTRRAEVKYGPDWTPQTFTLDATVNGGDVTAKSTFAGSVARTDGVQTGTPYAARARDFPAACRAAAELVLRGLRGRIAAPGERARRDRAQGLRAAPGRNHDQARVVGHRTDPDRQRGLRRLAPRSAVADSGHQRPRPEHHLHQGRRAGPIQRAVTGSRRGAGRRGGVDVAHAGLLERGRRSGDHPGRRLQPRRDADATGCGRRSRARCRR